MTLYIGFSAYEPGQDPLGDSIMRHAKEGYPEEHRLYPYPHCYLVTGHPTIGFHRTEVFTNGLSYVWYPAGEDSFQEGLYFKIEDVQLELYAMYRALDPWTRENARCCKKHIIKIMRGQQVYPHFATGAFSCTTFVLWLLGMVVEAPHRTPQLIEWLRAHPNFEEIENGKTTQEGYRWVS